MRSIAGILSTDSTSRLVRGLARVLSDPAAHGVRATAVNLGATLCIQVASVPLFLATIGVDRYAEWLVLVAIPTYLSLTDLGFSAVAATAATEALIERNHDRARRVLCSAWALVTLLSATVGLMGIAAAFSVIDSTRFTSIGPSAPWIIVAQLVAVLVGMQGGFAEAAMRAAGQFPRGMTWVTIGRGTDFLCMAICLILTRDPLIASVGLLVSRIGVTLTCHAKARARLAWFRLWPKHVSVTCTRNLLMPSLTFAAFPIGAAFVLQGMTIVMSWHVSSMSLVALTTTRTAVGLIQQLVVVLGNGTLAEITIALARRRVDRARRLYRITIASSLLLAVCAGAILSVWGTWLIRQWTDGQVSVTSWFICALAGAALADVYWNASINMLRAANRHQIAGVAYALSALLAVVIASWLAPSMDLYAVPLATLIIPVIMSPLSALLVRALFRQVESPVGAL